MNVSKVDLDNLRGIAYISKAVSRSRAPLGHTSRKPLEVTTCGDYNENIVFFSEKVYKSELLADHKDFYWQCCLKKHVSPIRYIFDLHLMISSIRSIFFLHLLICAHL